MKKKEMTPMKNVEWIVLHCSATRCNKDFSFEDLKRCHRAKGYVYDCGYYRKKMIITSQPRILILCD